MPIFDEILIDTAHLGRVIAHRHNTHDFEDKVASRAIPGQDTRIGYNQWQAHIQKECAGLVNKGGTVINKDAFQYPNITPIQPRKKGIMAAMLSILP